METFPFSKETLETVQRYTFMTDRFLNVAFTPKVAEHILSVIMDKNLTVERIQHQQPAESLYSRSVRFDVFAKDSDGKYYNIEVQNANEGATPRRARYNCERADTLLFPKGKKFDSLPELYVIFITLNDIIGDGLPIYHIERRVEETGKLFGDGEHVIYVNGSCKDPNTKLGQLVLDMQQSDATKIKSKVMADAMIDCKKGEALESMCKEIEEIRAKSLAEGIEQGIEKGVEKGRAEGRIDALVSSATNIAKAMNLSVEKAIECLGVDADIRDAVIKAATEKLNKN